MKSVNFYAQVHLREKKKQKTFFLSLRFRTRKASEKWKRKRSLNALGLLHRGVCCLLVEAAEAMANNLPSFLFTTQHPTSPDTGHHSSFFKFMECDVL